MQIDTQDKHDYYVTEIKKMNTRKDKLLDMYMDGDIEKDVWTKKTEAIETQKALLENQLKSMKQSTEQFIDNGKNIIECSRQAYNLYKQQTAEEKRRLLNVMFKSMTLENRTVKYTYKKPFCYFAKCDLNNVDDVLDYIKNNIKF